MAAKLQHLSTELEEQQFLLSATMHVAGQGETHLCGFVNGFAQAMNRARYLAHSGWKVTIDPSDPGDLITPRFTVEPIR